jgi:hypothetical protein
MRIRRATDIRHFSDWRDIVVFAVMNTDVRDGNDGRGLRIEER